MLNLFENSTQNLTESEKVQLFEFPESFKRDLLSSEIYQSAGGDAEKDDPEVTFGMSPCGLRF